MAKKKQTPSAGDVMYRRYYQGKSKARIAEASATMASVALGDKIRILREQTGLTQLQLARKVGTQASQISRIEDADYEGHSVDTLRRIATALHATLRIEFVSEKTGFDLELQPA